MKRDPNDIHVINAMRLFPDLKHASQVQEQHLNVARSALARQIARKSAPPVARNQVAALVHNESVRGRRASN